MRNFLILSVLLLFLFGGRKLITGFVKPDIEAQATTVAEPNPSVEPLLPMIVKKDMPAAPEPLPPQLETVLQRARSLEGAPYQPGGVDPEGFDCSGFVSYVYGEGQIVLPRSSSAMSLVGRSIPREEVRKGDLLFFTGSEINSAEVGHVALVLENTEERLLMIHASNRGVVIDDYYDMAYYQERYLSARRPYVEP